MVCWYACCTRLWQVVRRNCFWSVWVCYLVKTILVLVEGFGFDFNGWDVFSNFDILHWRMRAFHGFKVTCSPVQRWNFEAASSLLVIWRWGTVILPMKHSSQNNLYQSTQMLKYLANLDVSCKMWKILGCTASSGRHIAYPIPSWTPFQHHRPCYQSPRFLIHILGNIKDLVVGFLWSPTL